MNSNDERKGEREHICLTLGMLEKFVIDVEKVLEVWSITASQRKVLFEVIGVSPLLGEEEEKAID